MKYLTLLLILVFSFALLCFLYLNQGLVTISYFPGDGHQTPPLPLFAVIMLAVIAGVLMAGVIGIGEQLRLRLRNRQLTRQTGRLEQEVAALKPAAESVESAESGPGELPADLDRPQLSPPGFGDDRDAAIS